jgi:uncharacterized protein Smg (DUF494 family)
MNTTAVAFDTYVFVKELAEAGMPEKQAETISRVVQKSQANLNFPTKEDFMQLQQATKEDFTKLQQATKEDIAKLRQETKEDIAKLRQETREDIADLRRDMEIRFERIKVDLIKWVVGLVIAQSGLLIGVMMRFMSFLPAGS